MLKAHFQVVGILSSALFLAHCSIAQDGKIDFRYAVGQYEFRENGCLEIQFFWQKSGIPEFGLANGEFINSDLSAELLKMDDAQRKLISEVDKQKRDVVRQINAELRKTNLGPPRWQYDSPELRDAEKEYDKLIIQTLDDQQIEKWNWLNRRLTFFSSGPLLFLKHPTVSDELEITKQQIDELKRGRAEQAAWLRKNVNQLYFAAIKKQIEPLMPKQKKQLMELLGEPDDNCDIWTPSTMYWFTKNNRKEIDYDRELMFVESIWRFNLKSELELSSASNRFNGGGANLTRFFWYYRMRFANELQKELIYSQIQYLEEARRADPKFMVDIGDGAPPYFKFMKELFLNVRSAQEEKSFDRFVFGCHLRNIGLVETLKNGLVLGKEFVDQADITKLEEIDPELDEFLTEKSQEILTRFIDQQLASLTSEQKRKLKKMLIPDDGQLPRTMVPLESVYLGVVLGDEDRSPYLTKSTPTWGYRLPDVDVLTCSDVEPDERATRASAMRR